MAYSRIQALERSRSVSRSNVSLRIVYDYPYSVSFWGFYFSLYGANIPSFVCLSLHLAMSSRVILLFPPRGHKLSPTQIRNRPFLVPLFLPSTTSPSLHCTLKVHNNDSLLQRPANLLSPYDGRACSMMTKTRAFSVKQQAV